MSPLIQITELQTERNRSLTCKEGPHSAFPSQAGLVGRYDTQVVFGVGREAFHHGASATEGEIQLFSRVITLHH